MGNGGIHKIVITPAFAVILNTTPWYLINPRLPKCCVTDDAKHVFLPPPHNNPPITFPIRVPSVDRMPDLTKCLLRVCLCYFRGYVTNFVS